MEMSRYGNVRVKSSRWGGRTSHKPFALSLSLITGNDINDLVIGSPQH